MSLVDKLEYDESEMLVVNEVEHDSVMQQAINEVECDECKMLDVDEVEWDMMSDQQRRAQWVQDVNIRWNCAWCKERSMKKSVTSVRC